MLRRGLEALERQLSDPSRHPALRIAGILDAADGDTDAAREQDRLLIEGEEESWGRSDVD